MEKKPSQVVPEKCIGFKVEAVKPTEVTANNAILYSLGIGFSQDPLKTEDFMFTYELSDEFKVFPTYAACLGSHNLNIFEALLQCPGLPDFNPMMLLHGEHRIDFYQPVKIDSKLKNVAVFTNVADKGKGALLNFEVRTYEIGPKSEEKLLFTNLYSLFIRGIGGFGSKGSPQKALPSKPSRKPDHIVEEKTVPNQALIYRLSGDNNPLHVDPNMAAMGNFEKPILHGLCFYAIGAKTVFQKYCDSNPDLIKAVQARFVSHVFPGETIKYSLWKEGDNVIFSGSTVERGLEVVQGVVELQTQPKAKI